MKVILNKCYGGFDVSKEAYMLYAKKKGLNLYQYAGDFVASNKKWIYTATLSDEALFKNYFIKDMGDNIEINNEDYKKYNLYLDDEHRQDPILIEVVEELGNKASGRFGRLEVVEIPDNCYYKIDEYDGIETIYYSTSEIKEK